MADNWDIGVFRGQSATITATRSTGSANISGWTITFSVKSKYGDPVPLLTKTIGSGITITDAVNGVFTITLAAADTSMITIPNGTYYYDVWRTDAGFEDELAYGRYFVKRDVRVN